MLRSTDLRHFAVSAVSFAAPTLVSMLFEFLDAEAKKRPLSSKTKQEFKAVADYIELSTGVPLPVYPENAPRPPQESGKMTKRHLGNLLM